MLAVYLLQKDTVHTSVFVHLLQVISSSQYSTTLSHTASFSLIMQPYFPVLCLKMCVSGGEIKAEIDLYVPVLCVCVYACVFVTCACVCFCFVCVLSACVYAFVCA